MLRWWNYKRKDQNIIMEIEKITYALAAMIESAFQIYTIAHTGVVNDQKVDALLRGVLKVEPSTTASVYPKSCLKDGYTYLADVSTFTAKIASVQATREVTKYLFEFFEITDKYLKETDAREALKQSITQIRRGLADEVAKGFYTSSKLSEWYQTHIFNKGVHQIKIFGEKEHLTDPTTITYIRALIVSAIRACVLWKQVGGSQIKCFFNKSRISICAKDNLSKL